MKRLLWVVVLVALVASAVWAGMERRFRFRCDRPGCTAVETVEGWPAGWTKRNFKIEKFDGLKVFNTAQHESDYAAAVAAADAACEAAAATAWADYWAAHP